MTMKRLNATLLTISQSLPQPPVYVEAQVQAPPSDRIIQFTPIQIPQEIISPIENFPIAPVIEIVDVDQTSSPGDVAAALQKPTRKSRQPRARKKLKRVS